MTSPAKYALATGLKGFGPLHTTLRVRVLDERDGNVFVITADLHDAGTRLALDPSQIQEIAEADGICRHREGLVAFG